MNDIKMPGHQFLKKLGRTKLRPGGGVTTEWLFNNVSFKPGMKVLEVACNAGNNLITLYHRYGCDITGIDLDEEVVKECQENIQALGFDDAIQVQVMDATALTFADETFDVVINEAMLTMLTDEQKKEALAEYHRVLKKGGILLTHDVAMKEDSEELRQMLSRHINLSVHPKTRDAWISMIESNGFTVKAFKMDDFKLMDVATIIEDEGAIRAATLMKNGQKEEYREQFSKMVEMNRGKKLNYIVFYAQKEA